MDGVVRGPPKKGSTTEGVPVLSGPGTVDYTQGRTGHDRRVSARDDGDDVDVKERTSRNSSSYGPRRRGDVGRALDSRENP